MTTASTTAIFTFTSIDTSQLEQKIQTAGPDSRRDWSLVHSIYRSSSAPSSQPSTGHLQILQLGNHPTRTFLCTSTATPDVDKTAAVAIPREPGDADFRRLLRDKFGPLWQPSRQGELKAEGSEWELGIFCVQVADLIRDRGVAGGGLENKGTLLCVSLMAEDGVVQTNSDDKLLVQEFCAQLSLPEATAETWGDRSTWRAEAELWCSVLRQQSSSNVPARQRGPKQ